MRRSMLVALAGSFVASSVVACHATTPASASTCDLVTVAKLAPSTLHARCTDPASPPLCDKLADCPAIRDCIVDHAIYARDAYASWRGTITEGATRERLYVVETVATGYQSRALERTTIGPAGARHVRVTQCTCPSPRPNETPSSTSSSTADPPTQLPPPPPFSLDLGCDCTSPEVVCVE